MANSWRRERWDSLRLLTPNWQSRLPGHRYDGPDPDGYMTMPEVIEFISRFATVSHAPVRTGTTVTSVTRTDDGYRVTTTHGDLRCRCVVLASGACNLPSVPAVSASVPASVEQITPFDYRDASQLPDGGVLVAGAAATGVQLAAEIRRSGRPVTLAVGEHVRLPRTYRGRDVLWWMDRSGVWDQRYDDIDDLTRARRLPSPQLVGTPERATLDLNALSAMGVELVGRFSALRDGLALFSGGLRNMFALADLKMDRLLDTFDEWARDGARRTPRTTRGDLGEPERFEPTRAPESSRLQIDLAQRRDPDDRVGDRLPPRLQLAARTRPRRERTRAARRRRRRQSRDVRDRPARVAPPQVELHPRCRGRCARGGGSPHGLSRMTRAVGSHLRRTTSSASGPLPA